MPCLNKLDLRAHKLGLGIKSIKDCTRAGFRLFTHADEGLLGRLDLFAPRLD